MIVILTSYLNFSPRSSCFILGLPFKNAGRPMLQAFGLGISRLSAVIQECGISGLVTSVAAGSANLYRLVEKVLRLQKANSVAAKGDPAVVRSTGAAAKDAAKSTPMWAFNVAADFVPVDDGAPTSAVLNELRNVDSPAGRLQVGALTRIICSTCSGTPVADQGAKLDIPKGAIDLRTKAWIEIAALVCRLLPKAPHRAIVLRSTFELEAHLGWFGPPKINVNHLVTVWLRV